MPITLCNVPRLIVVLMSGFCLTGYADIGENAYAQPPELDEGDL